MAFMDSQTAAQSVNKMLYFAHTDNPQSMLEFENAIKVIIEISAALDLTQRTLEMSGSANQIELAEWVFNELDTPATAQASQSPIFTTYTEQPRNGKTALL